MSVLKSNSASLNHIMLFLTKFGSVTAGVSIERERTGLGKIKLYVHIVDTTISAHID